MEIAQELKQRAIQLGLCEEWTRGWGNPDKDELLDKYVRGIDFAIQHDFPSTGYMIRHFDGVMQKHGVYVSETVQLHNPTTVVACGDCEGKISFDEYAVGRMYVRHQSELTIQASGNAKVFISAYDHCRIKVNCRENAKVYIYRHGGEMEAEGNVLIKEVHG